MGKSANYYTAPTGPRRAPTECVGCRKPIVYGERCPPCAHQVRVKAAKRRRRR